MTSRLALFAAVFTVAGCAAARPAPPVSGASPPAAAGAPERDASPLGSPFGEPRSELSAGIPLFLDRGDVRLGTSVQFHRLPTASELHDLTLLPGLSRVVLSLDAWPNEYGPLAVLDQTPMGVELVAVLPGWPPSRASVDAWNYVQLAVRVVVVVPGPPPSIEAVTNLNLMRGLERVIAQMDQPSRTGFERLQRPLSFRKVMD